MANSIQTALLKSEKDSKYANIIASVILTLRSNVTEGKIVVVVEGADDCRLYERMYDADKVIIYPVNSCRHTIETIKAINAKGLSSRIIGIKDADFDHVNNVQYNCANLFLTDFHDAEILEIENDVTVNAVWHKYTDSDAPSAMKDNIYMELRELSMFKWYNHTLHLNIIFKKDRIGSCIDSGRFDFISYIDSIFSRCDNVGKNPIGPDFDAWCSCRAAAALPAITNGHDAVELMFHKVKGICRRNISLKEFSSSVRDSYPLDEYKKTNMAQAIDDWAVKNYGDILY